jgi:fructosamine-3-kinase
MKGPFRERKHADELPRYHHLNHYAIFGGGYKMGATSIMRSLLQKYGKDAA